MNKLREQTGQLTGKEYNMEMKKGKKIKYCGGLYCGEEIIETAYVLRDDGDGWIWISSTKEELKDGFGATIRKESLR